MEARGTELELGQAPEKGKTFREPAPCKRGAPGWWKPHVVRSSVAPMVAAVM